MDSIVAVVFLPIALAFVMFGLGLTLTVGDFRRVVTAPKAALIALGVQMLLLPVLCFGLVVLFELPPVLAVGMMLLAASPGGTTANLFSYLARGDVALNITLTAINSVLAAVTLPIVVSVSIGYFMGGQADVGMPPDKMIQVVAIVLVPVAVGMWVHSRFRGFAERMRRPVKIASMVILAVVIVLAVLGAYEVLLANAVSIGSVSLLLCGLSLAAGYWIPRSAGVSRAQSVSSTYEVGIHNSTLAITVALSVIGSAEMAVPPAIYGLLMYVPALATLYLFNLRKEPSGAPAATP